MARVGLMEGIGNVLFATTVRSAWRPPSASYQMDSRSTIIQKRPKRVADSAPACNIQDIARALHVLLHILMMWCWKKLDNILYISNEATDWCTVCLTGQLINAVWLTKHNSTTQNLPLFRGKNHQLQEMLFQETGCMSEQNWRRIRF
jgi:hypothetical protein